MHKLDRDQVPPACLARYMHGRDRWSMASPTFEEREQIWEKLDTMQSARCAYCESALTQRKRKIEHFRQRDYHPQGAFEWSNLFGACIHAGHCDSSKDNYGPYDHQLVIKPDEEDPEQFLVFSPSGEVRPRASLKDADRRRAQATIDILQLNERSLVARRKSTLRQHERKAMELAEIALERDDPAIMSLVVQEIEMELEQAARDPYITAIRHFLAGP